MRAIGKLCLLVLPCAGGSAGAEERHWSVSPYLWAAGIDGAVYTGSLTADYSADFGDIVNVLEGGILVGLESRSGRNALFADVVSLALDDDEARGPFGEQFAADVDVLVMQAGYGRSMSEGFRLEGGARYWDLEVRLDSAAVGPVDRSADWVDGFVGLMVENPLGDRWSFRLRGNVGAGSSDLALEVAAEFARRFANGNALTLGFRGLDLDRSKGGSRPLDLDVRFAGLTIGYTFNW